MKYDKIIKYNMWYVFYTFNYKKKKNVSFKLFCLYSSKQELKIKNKKNTYVGKYIYVYKMPILCTHYILISHVLSWS